MKKLVIFDLDGTIVAEPEFYHKVYSGTLTDLIYQERGAEGMRVLEHCRQYYQGKGELALDRLDIPFGKWAERLINAPLNGIRPQLALVERIRRLAVKKVIYTGSPIGLTIRLLGQSGFREADFDQIIGWKAPEPKPLKWSCSPLAFESIVDKFNLRPADCWAVGNDWETDLAPAKKIGIKTALICEDGGDPDVHFRTLDEFLDFIKIAD